MFRLLQRLKRRVRARLKLTRAESDGMVQPPRWLFKISLLVLLTALITALYPIRLTFLPISVPQMGDIAANDIIAPIDFPVEKSPEELKDDIQKAVSEAPVVLDFNGFLYDSIKAQVDSFFNAAKNLKQTSSNHRTQVRRLRLYFPQFDESVIGRILILDSLDKYAEAALSALDDVYFAGVISDVDSAREGEGSNVAIVKSTGRLPLKRDQVVSLGQVSSHAARAFGFEEPEINRLLAAVLTGFARPTLTVNYPQTERERTLAIASIPREEISFHAGEVIIRRNQKVEPMHLKWLNALAEQRARLSEKSQFWQYAQPVVGRSLLTGFILALFATYLYFFKRRESWANVRFVAVLLLILFQALMNYAVGFRLDISDYLIPYAIGSMMFAILFDLEIGLMATFSLAMLQGVLTNFDFTSVFINVASGSIACFSVKEVRRRTDFYRPVIYLSIGYVALAYSLEFLQFTEPRKMVTEFGFGVINAVVSPLLAMGFLPIFESLFNLTTDITLLELSDMNHPLMRRLAMEAPGTYHHSMVVGNLSENAAEAIGANPLLARVGAYYHDIGKMEIAEYFVENQSGIKNKHEKLTPNMSALIIGSHVKKGVELAEKFDLPEKVTDFIEEHHGTTLMTYFYNKAKESGENGELHDEDFRYPGPKPNSRETAIVMLADSAEAASRTLDEPKPNRIRNVIQRIINDKFAAGELSDSALTMHDLKQIENSFVNMLIGVFHARIDYPRSGDES